LSSKIGLNLTRNYSINFDLKKRNKKSIKFIIIHYTGMKNESDAIKRLCDSKSKVSSHYFIKNNGDLLNLVPDLYNAWHSGKSSWKKFESLNRYSIGIEINNPGHEFKYKRYSFKQISSLIKLLKVLKKKYKIKKQNILGHSDISPNRKKDPGEKFPWKKLARKKLCKWHTLNENKIKIYRNLKSNTNDEKLFLNNLNKIGYSKKFSTRYRITKINLVKAFQRRYRQSLINGKIDKECLVISQNLLKN
jgi:Negative regulator of beta-lactamase expression